MRSIGRPALSRVAQISADVIGFFVEDKILAMFRTPAVTRHPCPTKLLCTDSRKSFITRDVSKVARAWQENSHNSPLRVLFFVSQKNFTFFGVFCFSRKTQFNFFWESCSCKISHKFLTVSTKG